MIKRKKPKICPTSYEGRLKELHRRKKQLQFIRSPAEKAAELADIRREGLQLAEMKRRYREQYKSIYERSEPYCELEQPK